jgi:hypothetical protein
MAQMDAGEYGAAQTILGEWAQSSQELFAHLPCAPLAQDFQELENLRREIDDRTDLKLSRKKMMYESLYQQRSRKKSPA